MATKWVDEFCEIAILNGLVCRITHRVNGWPETATISKKNYYTKSVTYNSSQSLYFSGVDPAKIGERGDGVLICGGLAKTLRDIFIIPWEIFFETLEEGEKINTYRPPREYLQYKFKLKDRDGKWIMLVQGQNQPRRDVTNYRFNVDKAIQLLNKNDDS